MALLVAGALIPVSPLPTSDMGDQQLRLGAEASRIRDTLGTERHYVIGRGGCLLHRICCTTNPMSSNASRSSQSVRTSATRPPRTAARSGVLPLLPPVGGNVLAFQSSLYYIYVYVCLITCMYSICTENSSHVIYFILCTPRNASEPNSSCCFGSQKPHHCS